MPQSNTHRTTLKTRSLRTTDVSVHQPTTNPALTVVIPASVPRPVSTLPKTIDLAVWGLLQDNGNGGWSVQLVPTHEAALEGQKELGWDGKGHESDYPHEHGYISNQMLDITLKLDGDTYVLANPVRASFGQ